MGAYWARRTMRFSRSLSASSPEPDSFERTRSSSANRKLPLLGRSSPRVEAAGSQPQTEQARAEWNDARATVRNVNRPTKNERMENPQNRKKETTTSLHDGKNGPALVKRVVEASPLRSRVKPAGLEPPSRPGRAKAAQPR